MAVSLTVAFTQLRPQISDHGAPSLLQVDFLQTLSKWVLSSLQPSRSRRELGFGCTDVFQEHLTTQTDSWSPIALSAGSLPITVGARDTSCHP